MKLFRNLSEDISGGRARAIEYVLLVVLIVLACIATIESIHKALGFHNL